MKFLNDDSLITEKKKSFLNLSEPIRTTKVNFALAKNVLMIHETFGKIVCGLTTQELRFLEGLSPVTSNL